MVAVSVKRSIEDVFNKLESILRSRFRVALLDETKTAA